MTRGCAAAWGTPRQSDGILLVNARRSASVALAMPSDSGVHGLMVGICIRCGAAITVWPGATAHAGKKSLIKHTCRRTVCPQMVNIDQKIVAIASPAAERGQYPVKDALVAPPDKAVVQRLVRSIGPWRILPLQAVLYGKENPRDHQSIICTRNAVATWKQRRNAAHLGFAEQQYFRHITAPQNGINKSVDCHGVWHINGS